MKRYVKEIGADILDEMRFWLDMAESESVTNTIKYYISQTENIMKNKTENPIYLCDLMLQKLNRVKELF